MDREVAPLEIDAASFASKLAPTLEAEALAGLWPPRERASPVGKTPLVADELNSYGTT